MLRSMGQFTAALQHPKQATANTGEAMNLSEQRTKKIEEILLHHDEQLRLSDERQNATLRLLMQQSENLTVAFRTLETHGSRIQKLEDNQAV